MQTLNELIDAIITWAVDRNLINGSDPVSQYAKLISEAGETSSGILYGRNTEVIDGVGDMFVVLVIISAMLDVDVKAACGVLNVSLYHAPRHRKSDFMELMVIFGRLGDYVLKKDKEQCKVALSSAIRMLNAIGLASGSRLPECVRFAYNTIKNRKGVMFNGVFIKDSDSRYGAALVALGMADGTSGGESNG